MSYEIGHKYPIPMKILLIGISTRALAQSASAAGYEIISLDFFGDSDQPVGAEVHSLVRDLGQPPKLSALAHTARNYIPVADMIVVEAGLENEPALLELCPPNKRLGNSAEVIARVRDLDQLRQVLRGTCMRMPSLSGYRRHSQRWAGCAGMGWQDQASGTGGFAALCSWRTGISLLCCGWAAGTLAGSEQTVRWRNRVGGSHLCLEWQLCPLGISRVGMFGSGSDFFTDDLL
jgi:hypothetical protein